MRTALRSLPIASLRLGIAGVADVVELHGAQRRPYPIEYKRGRPKAHRADEVQLCAQAICLEEMFLQGVAEGALFYGEPRRRTTVLFDAELRTLTERVAAEVRVSINAGNVPAPIYQRRRCDSCSVKEVCRPKRLERPPRIDRWLARMVDAGSAEPP